MGYGSRKRAFHKNVVEKKRKTKNPKGLAPRKRPRHEESKLPSTPTGMIVEVQSRKKAPSSPRHRNELLTQEDARDTQINHRGSSRRRKRSGLPAASTTTPTPGVPTFASLSKDDVHSHRDDTSDAETNTNHQTSINVESPSGYRMRPSEEDDSLHHDHFSLCGEDDQLGHQSRLSQSRKSSPTPLDKEEELPKPLAELIQHGLGSTICLTVEHQLRFLPHISLQQALLLDLENLLRDSGCPLSTLDGIVDIINKGVYSGAFNKNTIVPKRDAFLGELSKKFQCPKAEEVIVQLEGGRIKKKNRKKKGNDHSPLPSQYDTVYLHRFDFQETISQLLMDVEIMGDLSNLLINPENKYGMYDPTKDPDPDTGEVLSSKWYQETYKKLIVEPTSQILIPIIMYMDKTGTDVRQKYGVEPISYTLAIFKQACRNTNRFWRILGYLPDLELSSAAARKKAQSSDGVSCLSIQSRPNVLQTTNRLVFLLNAQSRSARNYHKCLNEIILPLKKVQKGFKTFIRIGDEIRYMEVICPIAFVSGDGKSSDMLCCRRGTKKTGRVSRYCLCPACKLDDPFHKCELVAMSTLKTLVEIAHSEASTLKEKRRAEKQLKELSTHNVYNAFFDAEFGSNPFGIIAATPPDMMHMFELGILKYLFQIFVDTMNDDTKAEVDSLMEKLFGSIRSSERSRHHRYDFTKGATSLTLLNAHHWPGLLMCFYLLLLTKEGKEVCRGCFADEKDAVEMENHPDKDFPGHVSKPTTLTIDEMLSALSWKPADSCDGGDSDEESDEESDDDESENVPLEEESDGDSDDESEEDFEEESDEELDGEQSGKPTPVRETKKRKAKNLPCSLEQFVYLLEDLLLFHAWYKHGSPFTTDSNTTEKRKVSIKIRRLLLRLRTLAPRSEGYGWRIQKFHDLLHIVYCMVMYGNMENVDASNGERNLKDFAKKPAKTCQKRGQRVFLKQLLGRKYDEAVLKQAKLARERKIPMKQSRKAAATKLRLSPACYVTKRGKCKWLHPSEKMSVRSLHPVILEYIKKKWKEISPKGNNRCYFHTEAEHNGIIVRAHPDYTTSGSGPWYDFAMVNFDGRSIPAKLLCFFDHVEEDSGEPQPYAIVHPAEYQEELGNITERRRKMWSMKIAERWRMETVRVRRGKGFAPKLWCVPLKSLEQRILVVEEEPGLRESWDAPPHIWTLKDRRDEWHKAF